ncbi:hypothetical protein [Delftia sp. 60]|uniref:hypothetical protein n=1 Tax=Delftia sp. 60 TaxID=2035216 RepID=UPI001C556C98|nr:hypothetical protein [Delftia sp. 60]
MQIQTGMRRGLRAAVAALALWSGLAQALTVTDMAGRSVQVPDRVQRVLLGEGRMVYTMALLEGRQAVERVAGWQGISACSIPRAMRLSPRPFLPWRNCRW